MTPPECQHVNIAVEACDQTWGILCCDCNTWLGIDWEPDHVVPPELEAREIAQRATHVCERADCQSKVPA